MQLVARFKQDDDVKRDFEVEVKFPQYLEEEVKKSVVDNVKKFVDFAHQQKIAHQRLFSDDRVFDEVLWLYAEFQNDALNASWEYIVENICRIFYYDGRYYPDLKSCEFTQ